VNESGFRAEKTKIEEIVNIEISKNLDELRSFLGMVSFFRKFIPDFSHHSAGKRKTYGKTSYQFQ